METITAFLKGFNPTAHQDLHETKSTRARLTINSLLHTRPPPCSLSIPSEQLGRERPIHVLCLDRRTSVIAFTRSQGDQNGRSPV